MEAEVVRWAITGVMGLIVWFSKRAVELNDHEITMLKAEIQVLKDTRLHKDDFREFKMELRGQFEEIKQALRDLKFRAPE